MADKCVCAHYRLLEGIFRLFDYLSALGSNDGLNLQRGGNKHKLKQGCAFWEMNMLTGRLQRHFMDIYLMSVDGVINDEMEALNVWGADGNSVYDNPFLLYDDSGRRMDFITGCRIGNEMLDGCEG